MSTKDSTKYRALASQIIPIPTGIIIKRGCTEIRVDGEGALEAIHKILNLAREGASCAQIMKHFPEPLQSAGLRLIQLLVDRRILVSISAESSLPQEEKPLDVFHWHFESSSLDTHKQLRTRELVIVGVNSISLRLITSLRMSGFCNLQVIDHPAFQNRLPSEDDVYGDQPFHDIQILPYNTWIERKSAREIHCLIPTSDSGGRILMDEWNTFSLEQKCNLFPIVVQDLVGYIGPFVIPYETPCYRCLIARENSHLDEYWINRTVERSAPDGKNIVASHMLISNMIADIAAFELVKFYGQGLPAPCIGRIIEVKPLIATMSSRKILKVPRCPSCSPMNLLPSMSPYKETSQLPGEGFVKC